MKILGLNLCGKLNVGDANCSPLQYFKFSGEIDMLDIDETEIIRNYEPDLVIFGGASWPKRAEVWAEFFADVPKIGWGIGWTKKKSISLLPPKAHVKLSRKFIMYGHRDWGCVGEYLPCVSCMSELFDVHRRIERPYVFFDRWPDGPLAGYEPRMLNTTRDMGEILDFLGSGRVVVTTAYHGAYWGTLLKRPVVVVNPYSSKLYHFKYPPVVMPREWDEEVGSRQVTSYPSALDDARGRNVSFYCRVTQWIRANLN